jgi:mannose-6-phosphate isomerase-like protein (cupin superfamily)
MIEPGAVLDVSALGITIEIRETAASTGGELVDFDVVGRARGFLTQAHVHELQSERHEVISGSMRLVVDGREVVLGPGESTEVPAGSSHRQIPGDGDGAGRVRLQLRPAGHTEDFLARLAELSAAGRFNRWGFPRPLAAAELVRDFGDEGHAAWPPVRVQRALARALLRPAREYAFVDEWDVAAPAGAVFEALADARSYPVWWRPVYLDVESGGAPAVGTTSRQHFKGRLPYHLRTRSTITRHEPPDVLEARVDGDLSGRGRWTLTPTPSGTHVRFDWTVHADRALLRLLSPLLRPAFRWNHAWAIARAREGLEPYARGLAAEPALAQTS